MDIELNEKQKKILSLGEELAKLMLAVKDAYVREGVIAVAKAICRKDDHLSMGDIVSNFYNVKKELSLGSENG